MRTPAPPSPVRPPVDRRIVERRMEVRRQEARRRLRLAGAAAAMVAAVAGGWGLTRSSVLDVDRVRVRGAVRTPVDDVVAAAALGHRPALVEIRTADVARRVGRLPWVERVDVTRQWPGTVAVEVVERTPVAVVDGAPGGWALVDAGGRVLAVAPEPEAGLEPVSPPRPPGPVGSRLDPETRAALRIVTALGPPLAERIERVVVQPGGQVELAMAPRTTVRVGPPIGVEEKLLALVTLADHVDLRAVTTVDLRVPSAPVLTRGTAPG